MIEDVVIAYNDSQDEELRHFFQSCADDIKEKAHEVGLNYHLLNSAILTSNDVENKVFECNSGFVFSAFSHGSLTALYNQNNDEYISTTVNNYIFSENVVYTVACYCGCDLKDELSRQGVCSFWGYSNILRVCSYVEEFYECATEGLKLLLEGKNLSEAKAGAYEKYDNHIDQLSSINPIQAGYLLANKMNLIVTGDDSFVL